MANKTLLEVTEQLVESIEDFTSGKIDKEKAAQIANSTQVVINAAKVMLDFAKLTGGKEPLFFAEKKQLVEPGKVSRGCKVCKTFNICDTSTMKCKKTTLEYFEPNNG